MQPCSRGFLPTVCHDPRRPAATPIERARRLLGKKYCCGVVVYRGDRIQQLTETVFAVPDWWLLGIGDQ